MKSLKNVQKQITKNLILRQLFLFVFLFNGLFFTSPLAESAALSCQQLFPARSDFQSRLKIIDENRPLELTEMLFQLRHENQLFYQGKHKYKSGSEFLASNEFDWLATPFDHKPSDVLIAFGSNSAWEIAANKNVKTIYLSDWSPYPLIASAYLISPLIRVAMSPKELIILLSGRIPTEELLRKSLDKTFAEATLYVSLPHKDKTDNTRNLLKYVAEKNITDFELRFLTSYFNGLVNYQAGATGIGPFAKLRSASFAKLLNYYDQRYSPSILSVNNPETFDLAKINQLSVFSSVKNFWNLKSLYFNKQIKYALTEITDNSFYEAVQKTESAKGSFRYTLSITNIFDCGDYNGLTTGDLRDYLTRNTKLFGATELNPLVVFRTSNTQPPHGFYRYDLKSPQDINFINLDN